MSALESTFAELLTRLRAGEEDGETEFLTRYIERLHAFARSRLYAKSKVDAEDVVQSAMLSFAVRHTGEVDLRADEGLWAVLMEITLRHCNKWNKRIGASV